MRFKEKKNVRWRKYVSRTASKRREVLENELSVSKKREDIGFGGWPEVSLAEARKKRDEAKFLLKEGKDPLLEKKKLKSN